MEDIKKVGVAISSARREAGLAQVQLAELIGISERTVGSIERGAGHPTFTSVVSAANALGLTIVAVG